MSSSSDAKYRKYKNKYLLLKSNMRSYKLHGGDYNSPEVQKFVTESLQPLDANPILQSVSDEKISALYTGILEALKIHPNNNALHLKELVQQLQQADTDFSADFKQFNESVIGSLNANGETVVADQLSQSVYKLQNSMYHLQVKVILYKCSEIQTVVKNIPDPELSKKVASLFGMLNRKIKLFNSVMDEKAKICNGK